LSGGGRGTSRVRQKNKDKSRNEEGGKKTALVPLIVRRRGPKEKKGRTT